MDEQNAQPEPVDPAMEDLDATVEDADSVIGGNEFTQAQMVNQTKAKAADKAYASINAYTAM